VALTELPDERVLEIGIGDLEGVEAEGEAGVRIRWRGGGEEGLEVVVAEKRERDIFLDGLLALTAED
jgi:hypothetical protein